MTDISGSRRPRAATIVAAVLLTALAIAILVELLASALLIYRYRQGGQIDDGSLSSTVALFNKAKSRLGLIGGPIRFRFSCAPSPCLKEDPVFGWSANPGEHTYSYRRLRNGVWETMPVKTTINPDQSRWTGTQADPNKPTIYIFGDSSVFGNGVNDEQTFAYHLQMAKPDYNVRLFALGGYSLVHSYLRMQQLKPQIGERDIVIVGYGDYFDIRNVAAPSRLREIDEWLRIRKVDREFGRAPRAALKADQLSIDLVEQQCRLVTDYCNSTDPGTDEMRRVSVRLIRGIAEASKAKTYLLHFDGDKNNPVRRESGIETISALPEDFGYFINDDIEGFDPHPGPYWHYAIARKLIAHVK